MAGISFDTVTENRDESGDWGRESELCLTLGALRSALGY